MDVAGGGSAGPEDRPGGVFASGDRPGPPGCGFIRPARPDAGPGPVAGRGARQHRAIGLAIPGPSGDDEGNETDHRVSEATLMADRFMDSTLPAHDPNFPKPRGLLPVPPR